MIFLNNNLQQSGTFPNKECVSFFSDPIVSDFNHTLNSPVVLMGFGLPDENLHAPNEHFNLENFDKGILTICSFLELI
jgi:acetylornithine deacetylase/succinyl-diaminopimelate desuccinylase-like protein